MTRSLTMKKHDVDCHHSQFPLLWLPQLLLLPWRMGVRTRTGARMKELFWFRCCLMGVMIMVLMMLMLMMMVSRMRMMECFGSIEYMQGPNHLYEGLLEYMIGYQELNHSFSSFRGELGDDNRQEDDERFGRRC